MCEINCGIKSVGNVQTPVTAATPVLPIDSEFVPRSNNEASPRLKLSEVFVVMKIEVAVHLHRACHSRFKSAHGGRERLHALIHAKLPNVLDL